MNLTAREGRLEDLARCQALHETHLIPNAQVCWRVLPEMWRSLLSNGRMQLFLVENRAKPRGSRVVSFNASLFVTDEFCRRARSTLPPYLCAQVARRYRAGKLPVLNREQVAQANARDGLSVIMCFAGWEHDGLSREQVLAVQEKQAEAFRLAHRGYHVKEFLADPIGPEALQWMRDAGARLRRDYSGYFQKHRMPESSQRPWLVGLTKEEALTNPGSYLSVFFAYTPPRFHFNRSEQMLLQHALTGETCEKSAASLFISPWTVKKRWHAIYQRVASADPELLSPPVASGARAASRGVERRRHLLQYLRQHPEELRPLSR